MASATIILNTFKEKNDGSHPVVLQIIKDRKKKIVYIGHYVKKENWDFDKNLPTAKHPNSTRLKNIIRNKLTEAERIILDFEDKNKPFTVDDIVNKLNASEKSEMLFKFWEEIIAKLIELKHIGNSTIYQHTLDVFKEFMENKDLYIKHVDAKLLERFREFLIKRGCMVNTISIHLRTLRAVYNKAIRETAVSGDLYPFKNFKISTEETKKRAIKKDDIEKIINLDLNSKKDMEYARDLFLFSFYMRGMSFIDISYLKVNNIIGDRIYYTRKKTRQKFSIKITEKARNIIKKYNDLTDSNSYLFPILKREGEEFLDYRNAMRLTNKKLKKMSEMAKLSEIVSTYVARHSWATIAKRSGIPIAVISEGLGHDSEETTQIYLDSFENDVLDNANDLITG
jgi:site-specific recombinase XerD